MESVTEKEKMHANFSLSASHSTGSSPPVKVDQELFGAVILTHSRQVIRLYCLVIIVHSDLKVKLNRFGLSYFASTAPNRGKQKDIGGKGM